MLRKMADIATQTILGVFGTMGAAGAAGVLAAAPVLRRRSTVDHSIATEFASPISLPEQRDAAPTLALSFSFSALERLVKACSVYVQAAVDDALADGYRILGVKIQPEATVSITEVRFATWKHEPNVVLTLRIETEVGARIAGRRFDVDRSLELELTVPARFADEESTDQFHVHLDFSRVDVADPDEGAAGGGNSPTELVDDMLRNLLSGQVLAKLGELAVLSLDNKLLGETAPSLHPESMEFDSRTNRASFFLTSEIGLPADVTVKAPAAVHLGGGDSPFEVLLALPLVRYIVNGVLSDPEMRWTFRGDKGRAAPLRLGLSGIRTRAGELEIDLSLLKLTWPSARVDLRVGVVPGDAGEVGIRRFYVTNHPLLEVITRRIDDLAVLRESLSGALRSGLTLAPVELPESQCLITSIESLQSRDNLLRAAGSMEIRPAGGSA